ncbi:MAG: hypothetical protein AB7T63_05140 [Planctomycetota bacterium]
MSRHGRSGCTLAASVAFAATVVVAAWRLLAASPPGWVVAVYGVVCAMAITLVAWALGTFVLRPVYTREPPADTVTQLGTTTTLGFVLLIALLQLGGLLAGTLAWSGVALVALAAFVLVLQVLRRTCPGLAIRTRLGRLLLPGLCLAVLPYALRGLAPLHDWDSATCHLPIAGRLVEAGPWFTTPDLHLLYRPALPHTLYAALLTLDAETGIVALGLMATLAAGCLVWALAREVAGLAAARWAVAVFASISVVLELATDPRVDTWLMLAYLLGVHALVRLLVSARAGTWAVVGMAGAAACLGTKYNGIPHALVLGAGLSAAWAWRVRPRPLALLRGAGLALVVATPFVLGYVRNAVHWADPVYPFHSQVRVHEGGQLVPLQDLLAKAPAWVRDEAAEDALREAIHEAESPLRAAAEGIHPFLWLEAVWNREAFATKRGHGSSPFLVFAPFALLLGLRRRTALLAALFLVGTLAFTATKPVLRYQMPSLTVGAAAAGVVLARWQARWAIGLLALLLVAWVTPSWFRCWRTLHRLELGPWWIGQQDDRTWLARVGHNAEPGMARAALWFARGIASGSIPPTDRVWMVGEGKIHAFPLDAHPSPGREGRDWLLVLRTAEWDVERLRDRLWDEGYRWLLVNEAWFHFSQLNGFVNRSYAIATERTLERFFDRCCEPPAIDDGIMRVARLRAP